MKKSMVLKGLSGHAEGYVRMDETGMYCRVQLGEPAQIALVFQDGTQKEEGLHGIRSEQTIDCDKRDLSGCYVFRGNELLLVSDEAMRALFEKRLLSQRKETDRPSVASVWRSDSHASAKVEKNHRKANEIRTFPQRRWPHPPCWESAQYDQGRWWEPGDEDYSDPGC